LTINFGVGKDIMAQRTAGGPGAGAGSVTEYIYDVLIHRLRTGEFKAGERLVEARLTRELGVSRVPLREVLRRLAAEGAIEMSPHRGASVRVIGRREMAELFQVRVAVEGCAAALAAGRINEPGVREAVHELLDHACPTEVIDLSIDDDAGHRHSTTEAEIHRGIVQQSDNQLLLRHWQMLEMPIHRLRYHGSVSEQQRKRSQCEHEVVLRAMLAGTPDEAQSAMTTHVTRIANDIQQMRDAEFNALVNPGLDSP